MINNPENVYTYWYGQSKPTRELQETHNYTKTLIDAIKTSSKSNLNRCKFYKGTDQGRTNYYTSPLDLSPKIGDSIASVLKTFGAKND